MATEAGEEAHEGSRKAGRDPERHRQAERVDGQQQCSVPDRVAGCGDAENGPEHRPDARCPAKGEGKAHDISAGQRRRLAAGSEERRVGKEGVSEGRSRGGPYPKKKKKTKKDE